MARYVDLDKAENYRINCRIQNIRNGCGGDCLKCYCNNGGIEEVAPVVHAKWEWSYHKDESECSNCGHWSVAETNYCPNCNAKMN